MKKEDVKVILSILVRADGGCSYCASELFFEFINHYPEHEELARDFFEKKFEEKLGEEGDR